MARRFWVALASTLRRLAWLGAATTAVVASSPALPAAVHQTAVEKSIPDRVQAVREQIARDGNGADKPVLYRLSQFFNFPNFPNFSNFPNFPKFANFPNFPNFPKF
jgi:hypothetical protein